MEGFKVKRDFWESDMGVTFDKKGRPFIFDRPVQVKFLDTGAI